MELDDLPLQVSLLTEEAASQRRFVMREIEKLSRDIEWLKSELERPND
jgi:hypothetical protein